MQELALASLSMLGNLIFMIFLSLFIVIDKDKLLGFVNRVTPPRFAAEVRLFQTSVASSFGGFMRGQAIQALVLGAVAAAGSVVLDIEYMPLTTALVAFFQMIPFFGPFVSWAPPVVAAILTQPDAIIPITIIMGVGWFVTMNIVQPRVMSSSVGIHPVVVLLSVLIGLRIQGVVGAIFAIPVAAVISAFFFHYLNRSQGGPRDVASRAARRLEARKGRPVRVPTPPRSVGRPARRLARRRPGQPRPTNDDPDEEDGERRTGAPDERPGPAPALRAGHSRRPGRRADRRLRRHVDMAATERYIPSARATPRQAKPLSAVGDAAAHPGHQRRRHRVARSADAQAGARAHRRRLRHGTGDEPVGRGPLHDLHAPAARARARLDDGSAGWSVDGSPTDAVSLAFLGYFGVGFDLVASGINYGSNLGDDITYSGTVGAAMEAVLSGCPAFAMSQEFSDEPGLRAGPPGGGNGGTERPRARPGPR